MAHNHTRHHPVFQEYSDILFRRGPPSAMLIKSADSATHVSLTRPAAAHNSPRTPPPPQKPLAGLPSSRVPVNDDRRAGGVGLPRQAEEKEGKY